MRTRHRRAVSSIAALLALTLVAAACGDDDDADAAAIDADAAADSGTADSDPGGIDTSDWPDTLVFGAVPAEESSALEQSYEPIIAVLEAELGIDVEFFQATDYAGMIEAQIAGNADLVQYGPFSYVIAKNNGAEIDAVGAMVDEEGGEPGYQSYGIAQAGSGIESLADFEGRTVCFVDPSSTSGYLYPSAGLIEEDIDPDSDIDPVFAGAHDASVISVDNGDCEAGFAFDSMVEVTAVEDLGVAEGAIEVVWESEVIAGSPIAVRTGLPESLVTEIRRIIIDEANSDALLAAGLCEGDCLLTDEGVWGYAEVDDAFYDGVRSVCDATQAEACQGG